MQVLDDASIRAAADDKMTCLLGQSDVEQSRNQAYSFCHYYELCLSEDISKYCK